MFHCFTSVSIVFIQGVTRSAVLAYPNGGYWLAFKIQTFDVESSYFYLGLDICLPKGVGLYTCPSEVAALKQYIKLFCWCSRFLQLSLQLCVVRTSTHPISARKSGVHQLISVQAWQPTKCPTAVQTLCLRRCLWALALCCLLGAACRTVEQPDVAC